MQNTSFLKLVIIYVTLVAGVLLWSGSDKQKTLYDKYLITFQGIELEAQELLPVKYFLTDYLEFELKYESEEQLQFILPDKRIINVLRETSINSKSNTTVKITVKNGFNPLYQKLKEKLSRIDITKTTIKISDIYKSSDKNEFTIDGPEGIAFAFSQKSFFSK